MKRILAITHGSSKYLIVFIAELVLICGCSGCLQPPVITGVDAVHIDTMLNDNLQTVIRLKVYNPNTGSSHVSTANVQLYFHSKLICNSELDSAVLLKGKDTTGISLRSRINLSNLVSVFPNLLAENAPVFYAEGKCHVTMLGINWNVPVKQNVRLNIHELVSGQVSETFKSDSGLQIRSFRLTRLPGLQKTQFNVLMRVKNNFRFDYKLQGLDIQLYRKGGRRPLALCKITDTINQRAGGLADIPFSVVVNNANLLSEARLSDLLHASMDVTLRGTATVAINRYVFVVPIKQDEHVPLVP